MPRPNPIKEALECDKFREDIALSKIQRERADAEIEKVKMETAALARPHYKNPALYATLLPALAAISGLIGAWISGGLDMRTERLKIERDLLVIEAANLSTRKNDINTQIKTLTNEVFELRRKQNDLAEQAAAARAAATNALTFANVNQADLYKLKTAYAKTASELAGVQIERDSLRQWRDEASQVINKPLIFNWSSRGGRPVANAEKNRLKTLLNKLNPGNPEMLQRNNAVVDTIFDPDRD